MDMDFLCCCREGPSKICFPFMARVSSNMVTLDSVSPLLRRHAPCTNRHWLKMVPRAVSEEETQARAELDFYLPWTAARQHLTCGTVRFPGVKTQPCYHRELRKKRRKEDMRGLEPLLIPTGYFLEYLVGHFLEDQELRAIVSRVREMN